jgi:hypothetical protein
MQPGMGGAMGGGMGGANPMMQMMSGMMAGGAMMGAGHQDDQNSRAWWARDDFFSQYWKEVWMWTESDVARWLGVIEGLEIYAEMFKMAHINGLQLLAMDGMVMMQMGINQMGARAKLLDEINYLRKYGVSKHMHRYVTGEDLHPEHLIDGIIQGFFGECLFAMMEAVGGVFWEPAKGIRVEGADGFYEGCSIGIAGLIWRPIEGEQSLCGARCLPLATTSPIVPLFVAGFIEMTRKISWGLKNTPQIFDSSQERFEYIKAKVVKERREKMSRRQRGKKDKPPVTMDDDYATNPIHGLCATPNLVRRRRGWQLTGTQRSCRYEGTRRCSSQIALGCKEFITCPLAGLKKSGVKGFMKGAGKGTLSLICRPTAGASVAADTCMHTRTET